MSSPFLFLYKHSFHTFQCAFYNFRFLLYHIIFYLCSLFTNKLLLTSLNYLLTLAVCIISSIDFPLFVLLYFSLSSTIVSSLLFRVKSCLKLSLLLFSCSSKYLSNVLFLNLIFPLFANYFSCTIDYLRGLSSIKNPEEYVNNDANFLQKEFVRLGIIEEGEEISQEQLNLFRDFIKANKQFFKRLSSTLPKDSDKN